MNSKIVLRISLGLIIFHLLGHSMGHFTWKETDDVIKSNIIRGMDEHQFEFMGVMQTIGGHFEGYSLLLFVTLAMLACLTWIISSRTSQLVPILAVTAVTLIFFGIIEFIFFFPLAAGTSLAAGLLQLFIFLKERRKALNV